MKKIPIVLIVIASVIIGGHGVRAEVYDLDDLTEGLDNVNQINTNTTNTNVSEPSEQALTLAECLIYKRLEIDDAQCDKLMSSLSCPKYADYMIACEDGYSACLNTVASASNAKYSDCAAAYKSCTDFGVDYFGECSKKFPPRELNGDAAIVFNLTDVVGDVRVYYKDDPTPANMEEVYKNRAIQTGAAIFTGDNGSIMLTMPNGVTQWIGPNSHFRIADYFTGESLDRTYVILKNGNIRVGIQHPEGKNVAYTVITPLWKVNAKGTEFEITIADDGTETVNVISGKVELVDHLDTQSKVVAAGETVIDEYYLPVPPSLDPWYMNVWGWVGVLVVLAFLGLFGLGLTILLVWLVRRNKRS